MHAFTVTDPTPEQAALIADYERETRLSVALYSNCNPGQFDDIDSRRLDKILKRERDAVKVRLVALANAIVGLEQRKTRP